jgi:hypothetical protein
VAGLVSLLLSVCHFEPSMLAMLSTSGIINFHFNDFEVLVIGLLDTLGEVAGAIAAVEAAEKLDPDAGLLTKGIAAVAGFKGAGALEGMLEKKDESASDAGQGDEAQA